MSEPLGSVDVHQHLWPTQLIDALRTRSAPPHLVGWTLHLTGEPPCDIDPRDHDLNLRLHHEPAGRSRVCMSLSTPLGIENLPTGQAQPLLQAWRDGAAHWRSPVSAWAAISTREPDLTALKADLDAGFVGLQIGADRLRAPAALEEVVPALAVCESSGKPVFVHPGPVAPARDLPAWWAPVVDYVAQLQAAWWSWHSVGRSFLPSLRICFAAGAGLAPIHHERLTARGGGHLGPVHTDTFVETSSYGPQAIDALIRVLGVDVIVLGSDQPYAEPLHVGAHLAGMPLAGGIRTPAHRLVLGSAAAHAITTANPTRLLQGDQR